MAVAGISRSAANAAAASAGTGDRAVRQRLAPIAAHVAARGGGARALGAAGDAPDSTGSAAPGITHAGASTSRTAGHAPAADASGRLERALGQAQYATLRACLSSLCHSHNQTAMRLHLLDLRLSHGEGMGGLPAVRPYASSLHNAQRVVQVVVMLVRVVQEW